VLLPEFQRLGWQGDPEMVARKRLLFEAIKAARQAAGER
jgi:hypothetical protein